MNFIFEKDAERNEIIVRAPEKTPLIEEIEKLIQNNLTELIGYNDREAVKISASDVYCFIIENNKVYAVTETDKYQIKQRLYQLEEILDSNFIKINQSCIANLSKIKKFNASFSGSLSVVFKNGYTDYVSRRSVKFIKERLGLKL